MAVDRLKKKIGVGRHASSIKRAKQTIKRNARNKSQMSRMRTAIKAVRVEGTDEALKRAIPLIMKTAQKGTIHRNKADRLCSRLRKHVNVQSA